MNERFNGIDLREPRAANHLVHHLLARLTMCGATLADDGTIVLAHSHGGHRGAGFFGRLGGELKMVGQLATLRRDAPWPELSRRNLIGGGAEMGGEATAVVA